jgi:hypothetical protein
MPPFRIFIASPVYQFEDFRRELIASAREAEDDGMFEFCFFEKDHHNPVPMLPGITITDSIFAHFGGTYDAFFLSFRDRVGPGTRAEFDHCMTSLRVTNPSCELWWRQVDCNVHDASTTDLLTELHKPGGNTGMQRKDAGPVDTPDRLANLFVSKLLNVSNSLRNGKVVPFTLP